MNVAYAQSSDTLALPAHMYSYILEQSDSLLLEVLEEQNVLADVDWQSLAPDSTFQRLFQQVERNWEKRKNLLKPPSTMITYGHAYSNLDTFSNTSAQWHNYIEGQQNIQIGKIPLKLSGRLVFKDHAFSASLSNANVSFALNDYLAQQRAAYLEGYQVENLLFEQDNPLDLSPEALDYFKTKVRQTFYQAVVSSPTYIALHQKLEEELKKQAAKKDSVYALQDSLYTDSLQQKLNVLQQVSQKYVQEWDKLNKVDAISKQELMSKAAALNKEWQEKYSLEGVKSMLLDSSKTTKDKILLWTKDFKLGLISPQGSVLGMRNLALKGIEYSWEHKDVYGSACYGVQSLNVNSRFIPFIRSSFYRTFEGRKFAYGQIGYGKADGDHLAFSLLHASSSASEVDTSFVYPTKNQVFAIDAQKALTKQLDFKLDAAFSSHNLQAVNVSEPIVMNNRDRSAAELKLNYTFEQLKSALGLGYFYVGSKYVSLGNPFLLTNRQGLVASAKTQALKNLQLDVEARIGSPVTEQSDLSATTKDWQLIGTAQWFFSSSNSLTVGVSPNTFRQNGYGNYNISAHSFLFYSQLLTQHRIGEQTNLLSLVGYSNFKSDFQYFDTLSVDQFDYVYLQESIVFPNNHSLSLNITLGGEPLFKQKLSNSLYRLAYQFTWKQLDVNIGGQVLQLNREQNWRYGSSGSLVWRLGKSWELGADWYTNRPFEDNENNNNPWQIFANTHLKVKF